MDFVDYDEVAHHAGGNRIEALKVLESLDQVLNVLEQVAERRAAQVPLRRASRTTGSRWERPSRISTDSRWATCAASSPSEDVVSLEENVESWGRVGSVVDDLAGDSIGGQTAARASSRLQDRASP